MRPRLSSVLPLAAALLCVSGSAPVAGARTSPAAPPRAIPLTRGWTLRADPADRGVAQGLFKPGVASAGWRATRVPGVIDARPRAAAFGGTVSWYRLKFTAPPTTAGFAWGVHFEQVRRIARVWLNGREIGRHADPYVPFTLPARGLKAASRNTLVVRVDNRKAKEPREGWWNWGGLTRAVTLVPLGALETQDPGVLSEVDCSGGPADCRAQVLVDATVVNRSGQPQPDGRIALALRSPGAAAGADPVRATAAVRPLAAGETARVRFRMPVEHPQLWSPETPRLYDATLTTSAGDAVQQVDRMRVGLREVRVVDGMLTLNGRQLDLRGASIQEDVPGRGPALSAGAIRHVVAGLKALHANVTRAHYALDPRLLDALDAAGIMVWSQAPIYHRDRLLVTAPQRERALATLRASVEATRSHPAVITHSVANELSTVPDRNPGTRAYLDAARGVVEDLDPALPPSVDMLSYPGYARQPAYAQYPLIGINSYFGWYPGKPSHSTARLSDLGPFLDRARAMYSRSALVLTEFGAESTFAGPAGHKETYAFQSRYVRDVLDLLDARPFVGGAIYWTLREFAVKPAWDGGAKRDVARDAIHNKGLITYGGRVKPAFAVAAQEFARTPLYRDVSPAAALGRPQGDGGGGPGWLLLGAVAVLALLALDAWALAGLRGRRATA